MEGWFIPFTKVRISAGLELLCQMHSWPGTTN